MEKSKQSLFLEMEGHLLNDSRPSGYFENLIEKEPYQSEYPLNMLSRLRKIEQSPRHHPEGNVWNHTMLVLDNAAQVKKKSTDPRVFMWAALLHDIGKATTTKIRKGRITSYDHDKEGAKLAHDFLAYFTDEEDFIVKVARMVRWHMQILFVTNKLPFADIETMKSQVDVGDVALLGFCDRLGRSMEQDVGREIEIMENFIRVCAKSK